MTNAIEFRQKLITSLDQHRPRIVPQASSYAAVLVPMLLGDEPEVLLTVRAAHLKSHPGEVSFPGGMSEQVDASRLHTALRETHEEVGIAPHLFKSVGQLSTVVSRAGFQVFPIVGVADEPVNTTANDDEIAEIFTVPWQFFAQEAPELKKVTRGSMELYIPHFYYQDKHIWGLTAMVLLELINLVEGTQWPVPDFSKLL
ncbi:NUDIX hydrolase [Reinekea marinisedimentorum]|uniref:8-oxo-dGTP pyrophosphatase MutT (NUDIX family) n=1 Tax=Reinekea marinisedimentorum TaxID=230495 RepID=A0A4R3I9C4_9GAMM|nr:CoA pyrophosphatase [Reinekea marinisedimentorum]TCS41982.1 8-oxo-dGTP pyrophosphatase MutT (NUDIX family) [Reinekea marinisedimentorum]